MSQAKETFCLKWNEFQSHLTGGLKSLFIDRDGSESDVTLAAEGKYIQSHRFVLSMCSPYLRKLLTVNNSVNRSANTIVILSGIKFRDLEKVIHFMYHGEVTIETNEEVEGILEAGKLLEVAGLCKESIQSIKVQIQFPPYVPIDTLKSSSETSNPATAGESSNSACSLNPGSTNANGPTSVGVTKTYRPSVKPKKSTMKSVGLQSSFRTQVGSSLSSTRPTFVPIAASSTRTDPEMYDISQDSPEIVEVDPLALDSSATDGVGNFDPSTVIEDGPLGIDDEDRLETSEPIEMQIEELSCGSEEIYIKEEDVNYASNAAMFVSISHLEEDTPKSASSLSAISKQVSAERDSNIPGVPWFYEKYYPDHLEDLMLCYKQRKCTQCGMKFLCKKRMARHYTTHLVNNFPCRICGSMRSSDADMSGHLKSRHGVIGTGRNWD